MLSDELLAVFREDMNDQEEPQLWSDESFYR